MDTPSLTTSSAQAFPEKHFDLKGKLASSFTIELQNSLRRSLPFEDRRDFEEVERGFIAAPPYQQIMAEAGNVAWDMGSYEFLLRGFDSVFDSVHPSLQRQAILNMAYGLYEVVPDRIYQVRGFDLANMTIIKGNTGWILFDVLTCKETAKAALELVNQPAILILAKSYSTARNRGMVMPSERAKRARAVERAGFI
jgi:alkyl sulfatase BDS1-like metallo-beta-lactamase superfamily hydrolase